MMNGPLRVNDEEFNLFQEFIESRIGIKFPLTKKTLLESRLSTYVLKKGFDSFKDYFKYIQSLPELHDDIDYLVDKITTHTTSFFRENNHFDFLMNKGIPMITRLYPGETINCISLGSSTGEEMYSMAMTLETLKSKKQLFNYRIDAADISRYALLKAKEGIFKMDHLNSIPDNYLKYFIKKEDKLHATSDLKNKMRFFILNICKSNQKFPDTYHIVFCRNTLIYFSKTLQQNVINNISRILKPGGLYFMGHSESLHGLDHQFKRVEPTVYQGS